MIHFQQTHHRPLRSIRWFGDQSQAMILAPSRSTSVYSTRRSLFNRFHLAISSRYRGPSTRSKSHITTHRRRGMHSQRSRGVSHRLSSGHFPYGEFITSCHHSFCSAWGLAASYGVEPSEYDPSATAIPRQRETTLPKQSMLNI